MIKIEDKSKCSGCYACYNICPKRCVEMKADNEGFCYPETDTEKCTDCGKCEKVCPEINGKTKVFGTLSIGYAAYNLNEKVRMKSSSGGIFTLLAEHILSRGGVVIGAAMSDDCKSVKHFAAEKIEDSEKMRGSKYLQSSMGDMYAKTENFLKEGRKVLFTGTPCQIGGLVSYLGKEYEGLYTQDLICHGVPSPAVWEKYAESMEVRKSSKLKKVDFRNKNTGWKRYSLYLSFINNKEYAEPLDRDMYMKGFLSDLYLRPSCYKCSFKTLERQSDITLADLWGADRIIPGADDDKGISFVWLHSDKGKDIFDDIKDKMKFVRIEPEEAVKFNSAAVKSAPLNPRRENFFKKIGNKNIVGILKKYNKTPLLKKIKNLYHNFR